jgi:hypothetical protein
MQDTKLDFWIKKNYNVLFEGKHGVGKTARIIAAFDRAGLKYKYFSASTLDPWVDFVGVPKEVTENGQTFIDLIRPKCFADDAVEAIFLDEYNRSQPKVRNATMELVQFKSINGRKFNNLRIVWVAINPDSDGEDGSDVTYDVEKLDPAQKDRFHVHVIVPYKPDLAFFRRRFGDELGTSAVSWWGELEVKEKELVSPRRLEYALQMYTDSGDVRDVLSSKINVSKLISELKNGSFRKRMEDVFEVGDATAGAEFIRSENNYNSTIKYIGEDAKKIAFFLPLMPEEKQVILVSNNGLAQDYAFNNYDSFDRVIASAATDKKVQKRLAGHIRTAAQSAPLDVTKLSFITAASKIKKSPSGYTGYQSDSITALTTSYSQFISRGTTYRRQYFESLTATIVDSYIKPGKLVNIAEAKLAADALYNIITSTSDFQTMSGFYGFDSVFAWIHKMLKDFGEHDYITKAAQKRVDEYVKHNLAKFV